MSLHKVNQITRYFLICTPGGFHEPSMIVGGVSFGQYSRSIKSKFFSGAGSQFDSLSFPGDWF